MLGTGVTSHCGIDPRDGIGTQGRRWGGQALDGERLTVGEDGNRAIEALMDFDPRFGQTPTVGDDLEQMGAQGQGVIIGDGAEVLEAEDGSGIERVRPGAVDRLWVGGGLGEARIVAGDKPAEEHVGLRLGADAGHPEFSDEAILQGPEEALDPSLGLRTAGGDPADAQFLQDAADLRGSGAAAQLFFERPGLARGACEDAVAVRVAGEGQARTESDLPEDLEVGGRGFDRIEMRAEDLASGVIDRSMEDEHGAAVFQPVVMAAVKLDEHAFLGHALAAGAMARRTSGAGAAQSGGGQEAMDGGPGEVEVLLVGEELGEVLMIDARVLRAGEAKQPIADPGGGAPRRGTSPIAVGEGDGAAGLIGAAEAPDLTGGQTQQAHGVCHRGGAALQGVEDHQALMFLGCQCDRSHENRGFAPGQERTFSLNA